MLVVDDAPYLCVRELGEPLDAAKQAEDVIRYRIVKGGQGSGE